MADETTLVLDLPSEVLRRHGARVLDPVTAARARGGEGQGRSSTTAYLTGTLLVRGLPGRGAAATIDRLRGALQDDGYDVELTVADEDAQLEGWLGDERSEEVDAFYQTRVRLGVDRDGKPLDADDVLVIAERAGVGGVDLEHLVLAAVGNFYFGAGGPGHWEGHGGPGHWEGHGVGPTGAEIGARTPVALGIATVSPESHGPRRRPVVVVPDTGLGRHPWFPRHGESYVLKDLDGVPVGPPGGLVPDPEDKGVRDDLTGALDRLSGHGTFIAGVVRQACAEAVVVALPVLDSSGAVAEGDLHRTLVALWVLHVRAQDKGHETIDGKDLSRGLALDVLNLSMGFYHQDADTTGHPMRALLEAFGERGVLVVAAAGNDATREPLYPAGWAAGTTPPEDRSSVPLVAVGALNPDGSSVAMFSNAGPWVTTHAAGANVVSTLPTSFQASAQPRRATTVDGALRSYVDPDDLSGGFAVWSGTSFAAPRVGGEVADVLADLGRADGPSVDPGVMTERAWKALGTVVWPS